MSLGPLPEKVGFALRMAQVAVFRRFRKAFAAYDIRPAQLGVLTVVSNNPGLTQSQVSAALGIKRTNFGPLLETLVSRGLVARKKVSSDRRVLALYITEAGARLLDLLHAVEDEFEGELTAAIGPTGRRQLLRLLSSVEAVCREDGEVEA